MSAIQSVTGTTDRPPCGVESLLDQTSRDLDDVQQRQLAGVLLRYSDLFPTPGSTFTGHTDAVEHEIDMGDGSPIRCAPRRTSPQKMKKECVAEMLTGGQIEPSDSAWSSPVVLVTKKDGGTRFCVDSRRLNDATVKEPIPCPELTILWLCCSVNSGSLLWTWRPFIGRFHCHRKFRRHSRRILGYFSSGSCRSDCAMHRPHSRD